MIETNSWKNGKKLFQQTQRNHVVWWVILSQTFSKFGIFFSLLCYYVRGILCTFHFAQKMNFSIKEEISVNVTKSTGNCGFGHIFWRYPEWKTSFFVQCHVHKCYWFLLTIFFNLTKFGPTISILLLRLSEYRFDFALPCA